ncbi:MAG TPA: Ig-like domain-containing protein [Kofleriaceae bacterium]|jgi:hypothetical protein
MKLTLALGVGLIAAVVPALAHADRPRATYRWLDPGTQGVLPYAQATPANVSHVIYMNNCQPSGCALTVGNNDSTHNVSSIPTRASTVTAYSGSAANWSSLVQCVQQTYAPFDVQIVDTRPASGNYHMAIVAGRPADVEESNGVLGVSPFTCGYISNSISFTFADLEPTAIDDLCWTVAQESAHSWGLDHKFDDRDPMTYLDSGPAMKTFQNEAGDCGEYQSRTCMCDFSAHGGSNTQENSYQLIMDTFGSSAPDTVAPTVHITSPSDGDSVQQANFSVVATVTDDREVAKAELRIDGQLIGADTTSPFQWTAPMTLGMGSHTVEVKGYDGAGNTATDSVSVTYGSACDNPSDCPNDTDTCVDGHCVAGSGATGGLGDACTGNSDCASLQCGDDGAGHQYCVVGCDPTANGCPSGFGCLSTGGAEGVCWPGANGGGGGGCNTNGAGGATFLVFGLGAFLFARRRW